MPNHLEEGKLKSPYVGPYGVVEILPCGNLLLDNGARVNQAVIRSTTSGGTDKDETSESESEHETNNRHVNLLKSRGDVDSSIADIESTGHTVGLGARARLVTNGGDSTGSRQGQQAEAVCWDVI